MTHASLCKKTYKSTSWFHPTKSRRMGGMRAYGFAAFLFLASAGIFPAQGALTITTTFLPAGTVGVAYSAQLQSSGGTGTVHWSIVVGGAGPADGTLPAGLNLSTSGLISGVPTTVGSSSFTVSAEDQTEDVATQPLSIQIAACGPTLTPASLPDGDVNTPYPQVMFSEVGCSNSASFTFTSQPNPPAPGLVLRGGVLSGTPTQLGANSFYITPTGPDGSLNPVGYTITVNPQPTITTTSPLPSGLVGVPYSQQVSATGGLPGPNGYKFFMNNNPPGISMNISGLISGTPTEMGTFGAPPNPITIEVEDSLNAFTESQFQVSFLAASLQLQVSPLSLTFDADFQGGPPPSQTISVVPASSATPPVNFSVLLDSGPNNAAVPSWLSVTPTSGGAPAGLAVNVNPGKLAVAAYPARIRVLDSNNLPTDVAVSLNVKAPAQQLKAVPSILRFAALASSPGTLVEDLLVTNSGAGMLPFTASVTGGSSWISKLTPSAGHASSNTPVFLQVQVNTSGLQVGSYHDIIQLASSAGNVEIPVSVFVAAGGPLLAVNQTGVFFQARQNGGSSITNSIEILNAGDPTTTVNWTASLVTGSNWLSLASLSGSVAPVSGIATAAAPGILSLKLAQNATQLTPGPYYALVKIVDPNSLNSPQYVVAVLNLEPDSVAASPIISPTGVFFSTPLRLTSEAPSAQVIINTSSATAVPFQVATTTANQAGWLSATPSSGNADGQTPGKVTISVNPSGLVAGIYTGNVNISMSGLLQSVNVTFVVLDTDAGGNARSRPEATDCTPHMLAITETGLPNNFAVPAGWPATLIVQLNDDCGAPVLNGNVFASFSNGDAPLALVGDSLGNYSATWQPGAVTSEMVVNLNAAAGTLQPAAVTLYGGISQNQTPPPTLALGGTLNDFNPVAAGPLSPGMIAQVYGSGLSPSPISTGILPLPKVFNNTYAQVGDSQAPFYFLSGDQLNVQIPAELTASQQLPMVLSVNNALTLPITLDIVPNAPGVLSCFDGPKTPSIQNGAHLKAQHLNGTLVTSANPAKPGEYLVMYLTGLGATDPPVASGMPAPAAPKPLANVTVTPIVTVDSLPSNVIFAGLAPTFVGEYQIDFQVPSGTHSGEVVVTVTQNGVAGNPTLLPVKQ